MVKENFLQSIGRYRCLQGNDLRFLLVCYGRVMYPKQIADELHWKKQNVSATAKKLESLGLIIITDYPVTYHTNDKWVSPELPGQIHMDIPRSRIQKMNIDND